jgi:hypothetical protein
MFSTEQVRSLNSEDRSGIFPIFIFYHEALEEQEDFFHSIAFLPQNSPRNTEEK